MCSLKQQIYFYNTDIYGICGVPIFVQEFGNGCWYFFVEYVYSISDVVNIDFNNKLRLVACKNCDTNVISLLSYIRYMVLIERPDIRMVELNISTDYFTVDYRVQL